jgi:hypothetical protein
MARKRPITNVELEMTLEAMKPGEFKRLPQFDMAIKKGIDKDGDSPTFGKRKAKVPSKVILRKKRKQ